MNRHKFVAFFALLCVAFVPILIDAGVSAFIVPLSSIIIEIFENRFSHIWFLFAYFAIYLGVFVIVGYAAHWLISRIGSSRTRSILFAVVVIAPFAASFARVLTYGSIRGRGGTYNFWEAVHRYFEKRPK